VFLMSEVPLYISRDSTPIVTGRRPTGLEGGSLALPPQNGGLNKLSKHGPDELGGKVGREVRADKPICLSFAGNEFYYRGASPIRKRSSP